MDAKAIYLVKFWVKPGSEEKVFTWLDGGHLKDVVAQPGFLWARRYRMEDDKDGWRAYAIIYGVESLQALKTYSVSAAAKRYAQERIDLGLDPLLKMERSWGTLDKAVGPGA
jgi:hypothetical protein